MGIVNKYYIEEQENAVLSFMQEIPEWGNISCFSIVFASSAMQDVIVGECYQSCLTYLWTGAIEVDTPIWKVSSLMILLYRNFGICI